jgi:hypothetical protein
MDNLESVRWELKDRTNAHEHFVREVRMDAELAEPKIAGKTRFVILPLLASVAGVLVWLMAR